MQNTNLCELEEKLGYKFKNIQYLETALTHSSYSNELKLKGKIVECNERLEFLGDSVLSIIAANYLFTKYPNSPEGELTRRRAVIVCRDALSSYAKSLNLGDFLFLGNGEEKNNARERKSLLENTFEALMGAIYLDGHVNRMEIIFNLVYPFFEAELCAWEEGKIDGICARGGFEVEINWKEGKLTEAVITSNNGGRCSLRYGNSTLSFNTKKGGTYKVVFKNGKLRKA